MNEKQKVYSLSICGRAILDMHSLNNEGGEGNQIATRMVNVVYRDPASNEYKLATVNAVSGDMFKHIQAEHLYLLARSNGLPLCDGCKKFSASRILDDAGFMQDLPGKDSEVIDKLLKHCALDDLEGNLIAKGARSVPRKSVAEFGWVVGVPYYTTTESYFHVRYATERGERTEDTQQQAIFHRPASDSMTSPNNMPSPTRSGRSATWPSSKASSTPSSNPTERCAAPRTPISWRSRVW
jgi:CRISPR-associated protein Cst2